MASLTSLLGALSLFAVEGNSSCLGTAKEHSATAEGCWLIIPAHINTWDVPPFSRRMPQVVPDCTGKESSCKDLMSLLTVEMSWQLVKVPLYWHQECCSSDSRAMLGTQLQ